MIIDITKNLPRHPTKRNKRRKAGDITSLIIHTTDSIVTPERLATYDIGPNHISKDGCPSITYHYLIQSDGFVYKTLDHTEVSWHCTGKNQSSLGIALVYRCTNKQGHDVYAPNQGAIDSLCLLLSLLCRELDLTEESIWFHRDFNSNKTCPGLKLNRESIRAAVAALLVS